jgi:hypothetical protein
VGQALVVRGVGVKQFAGQDALRQIVDPPPAVSPDADDVAHVQQPLDGDLRF